MTEAIRKLPNDVMNILFELIGTKYQFYVTLVLSNKAQLASDLDKFEKSILSKCAINFEPYKNVEALSGIPNLGLFKHGFCFKRPIRNIISGVKELDIKLPDRENPNTEFLQNSYICDDCRQHLDGVKWLHCVDSVAGIGKCDADFCENCLKKNPQYYDDHTLIEIIEDKCKTCDGYNALVGEKLLRRCFCIYKGDDAKINTELDVNSKLSSWICFLSNTNDPYVGISFHVNICREEEYFGHVLQYVHTEKKHQNVGNMKKFNEAFYRFMKNEKSILIPWLNNHTMIIKPR